MKNVIAVIICFLFSSCLGVVDKKNNIPVTEINKVDLLGKWKADKFSYEYTIDFLKNEKQLLKDTIYLELKDGKKFYFYNGIIKQDNNLAQGDFTGRWEIEKKNNNDQFEIVFYPEKSFGMMPSRIPIYKKDNLYELFIFIGDPGMGERIGLKKKIIK